MEGMRLWTMLGLALFLATFSAGAQRVRNDTKTRHMIEENTAAALVPENRYRVMNDSVEENSKKVLSASTIKLYMKTLDMQARMNRNGFKKENRQFYRLVWQISYLTESVNMLVSEVAKNQHHMVFCRKQIVKILLEAKALVKYTVVVAYNSKVPNPFKMNKDSIEKDLATIPEYYQDNDVDSALTDRYNLLLPDDRLAILRQTTRQLKKLQTAVDRMYWKMLTDFTVRNLIWEASKPDGRLYDNNVYQIQQLKANLNRMESLF